METENADNTVGGAAPARDRPEQEPDPAQKRLEDDEKSEVGGAKN